MFVQRTSSPSAYSTHNVTSLTNSLNEHLVILANQELKGYFFTEWRLKNTFHFVCLSPINQGSEIPIWPRQPVRWADPTDLGPNNPPSKRGGLEGIGLPNQIRILGVFPYKLPVQHCLCVIKESALRSRKGKLKRLPYL